MLRFVYYSILNLLYYRKERQIPHRMLMELATPSNDLELTRRRTLNALLATVGLRVSDKKISWYIPLSKIQRSWIKKAKELGYEAELI